MKNIYFLFFFFKILNSFQIQNINSPICSKCKHFEPGKYISKDDSIKLGKCKYFGKKDIYSGKIEYDYATMVRESKCGINGTYYEYNKNYELKFIKTYVDAIVYVWPFILLIIVGSVVSLGQ